MKQLSLTANFYNNLKASLGKIRLRESLIPEEEVDALIEQIIDYPYLGGHKGSLKLLADGKSILSGTVYKEVKALVEKEAGEAFFQRKNDCAVRENVLERNTTGPDFEKISTTEIHEVWATDFVYLKILGMSFALCVVYDLFSQAYLALEISDVMDADLAEKALKQAHAFSGCKPSRCLLSDNGSQFISMQYQEAIKWLETKSTLTPPGCPWFNGALESGNRDLRKVICTAVAYLIADQPELGARGVKQSTIHQTLSHACNQVQNIINEQIPRPKHGATPMQVLRGEECQARLKDINTRKQLQAKRQVRMQKIKRGELKPKHKSLEAKALSASKKVLASMNTDKLYSFWNLIAGRTQFVTD